ncbi:hypothetical protein HDU87_007559 [Geranomyces variabilis]|uniref:Uncharacterized protein n=1 Tax=Geranomyces variabilis TaxID=109894 RepID=A0AAD5TRS8_9FUNG|nr:hypothetical protein HDU87_007559 [Geranomyces variabilis]
MVAAWAELVLLLDQVLKKFPTIGAAAAAREPDIRGLPQKSNLLRANSSTGCRDSAEPYRNSDADNDDDTFYDALFPVFEGLFAGSGGESADDALFSVSAAGSGGESADTALFRNSDAGSEEDSADDEPDVSSPPSAEAVLVDKLSRDASTHMLHIAAFNAP